MQLGHRFGGIGRRSRSKVLISFFCSDFLRCLQRERIVVELEQETYVLD
jgi:hypothetical protein